MNDALRAYYEANPLMVSSPFGGVDAFNEALFLDVAARLGLDFAGCGVLDVGCGRGFPRDTVVRLGGAYTGIDFVITPSPCPKIQGDAARLPFVDSSFDGLLCIDAMEHFPDLDGAAREFRRVLRPGGFWFLSAPNYANVAGMVKRVYETAGWYERDTWAPFRRWQPQELEQPLTAARVRRCATAAGFRKVSRIGHGPEVGLGLFPWIDHPRMPDAVRFRLQRLFGAVGPAVAKAWPDASLHSFYRMDV